MQDIQSLLPLTAVQELIGAEPEAILEFAVNYDTPQELILAVKNLIQRSKQ